MKDWATFSTEDELQRADSLLNQADALLGRRRESSPAPSFTSTPPAAPAFTTGKGETLLGQDDDLPILTDIVDEQSLGDLSDLSDLSDLGDLGGLNEHWLAASEIGAADDPAPEPEPVSSEPEPAALNLASSTAPSPAAPELDNAAISAIASARFTETLIELDTEIARSIEEWMEREFPQFLQRELALMQTRLHKQLHEHLNATLLSEISTHISRHLGHSPLPEQTQD
ncbi:MAG: hypothetical protein RBR77_10800 [Thauera sp.]|jgi:hypothetical protein|nr:hypothetical protein [Thauera sp.]